MSLTATLNVGKSALAVTQAAIQTHGNNIANAGDPNYNRQVARPQVTPGQSVGGGHIVGTGTSLAAVERQVDDALVRRLNFAAAEGESSRAAADWLRRVESAFNELSDNDLSTAFSDFFASYDALAADPTDAAARNHALATAQAVASRFNDLDARLRQVSGDLDARVMSEVEQADSLASQIAELNVKIVTAEGGGNAGPANALRDRRDGLIGELSSMTGVHAIEQTDGAVNLYVGSEPAVLAGEAIGFAAVRRTDGEGNVNLVAELGGGGGPAKFRAGSLAGAGKARGVVDETLARLDAVAGEFAHAVNAVHATGQGLSGHDSVTSRVAVDAAVPLDQAGLVHPPRNGSFVVHLRDAGSGDVTSALIDVPAGATLADVAAGIDGIAGVSATVADGRLTVAADAVGGGGQEVTFGEDTSGLLAAINLGGLFAGDSAGTLEVAVTDPRKLAASRDNTPGDGATAALIADVAGAKLDGLGGADVRQAYEATAFEVAREIDAAETDAEAAGAVAEVLAGQRDAISGVSLDEEAVSLLRYQRTYQGAARLIAAVDEMMQTLLQLV